MTKIQEVDVWCPIKIGDCQLSHRVVLAPLTRNRGTKSSQHDHTWVPNELMKEYYSLRATPGGLLISEATPVSLRASGLYGIPGNFTPEQQAGWKTIVSTVHAKGGYMFNQLWHQGRTTHSGLIGGQTPESSSDVPIDGMFQWNGLSARPYEVPRAMSKKDILDTQADFVQAAKNAMLVGFDGIEVHGGNGYLFDQFLHSNINTRTDEYGGSSKNRCRFVLETIEKLCDAIGPQKVAIRLTPFGLFGQTYGSDRLEQWSYLCAELSKFGLAYVHLIEPRFDELKSAGEKQIALKDMVESGSEDISLLPFRKALCDHTPIITAGGFGPDNMSESIKYGVSDLVAFGRYFVANPDLIDRLKNGEPLYKWDRSRFYGPFDDNELGYTVFKERHIAEKGDILKAQLAD
ncbi:uncharacterized protein I303_104853 [Kwoniella dejecticola CBS 10117]|uniref:NADH:flavin oxidoreductase/NADH oxidase N-terminal domain-containing protein n=1 Tax=Kwoniella dejecticola CBS 10117 TaxID=1296121 RepID=A0A1A6A458_9TREE|nr:uncharacterized protein I303_04164 [Kwoniella dejecticola CBS 10117]OBR84843.1 hypothetical protein I303_04164 [Kwoniella dejecticola CBS 10117]